MKKILSRSLMILLVMVLSFNLLACKKDNNLGVLNNKITPKTENTETRDRKKKKSVTDLNSELVYDKSKTLSQNIDILNKILDKKYKKSLTISTVKEYEKTDQADWTLVLENNRVGIDTATWKFDYDANSDDSKYMDAILSAFIYFCGDEMGKSLWQLTSDLLDGGADETLYGFEHDGSQAIYKNGNVAAYESSNSKGNGNLYIWLIPSEY